MNNKGIVQRGNNISTTHIGNVPLLLPWTWIAYNKIFYGCK